MLRFGTGFIRDKPDDRDRKFQARLPGAFGAPPAVDFSAEYPPCLQQGTSNSCTSNATANALLYLLRLKGGPGAVPQSRLFIYWNGRKVANMPQYEDQGLGIRDAMKSVKTFNSIPENVWPFDPVEQRVRLQPSAEAFQQASIPDTFAYESVPQDEHHIRAALAQRRPVVLGIHLRESFYNVGKDGLAHMTGNDAGWHAVAIVGYDDSRRLYKLQNSWGSQWGQNGFFYLPYDYIHNPATAADLWTLKAFEDGGAGGGGGGGGAPSAKFKMQIKYGPKALVPTGGAPDAVQLREGASYTWDLDAVGPDTYTVAASALPSTLLSAWQAEGKVDTWTSDDGSGRQRWKFAPVDPAKRLFNISVEGGLADPAAKYLTVTAAGALTLQPLKAAGHGAVTQQFKCIDVTTA